MKVGEKNYRHVSTKIWTFLSLFLLFWSNFRNIVKKLLNLLLTMSPKYRNKFPFHRISEVKTGIFPKPKCFSITEILVCPQTFSHTVMCKVCLTTASNMLFDADTFVRLHHWILSNIWRVRFCCAASLNSPNIFCLTRNTIYSPFT